MILRSILDPLAAVFFPAPCRVCGGTLTDASPIPLCPACLASIVPITGPVCECCGRPIVSLVAEQAQTLLCHLCRRGAYAFDLARSFATYNDPMQRVILLLKYERVTRLGKWFARPLETVYRLRFGDAAADVIVPVPLHAQRERERGYNQAEVIARPLANRLGIPLAAPLLVRTKPRPEKLLMTRRERWESVRGAYETRPGSKVDNLRVLLVDDVFTTGATLDSCARALRKGGAAAVYGLTVARAVPVSWAPPAGSSGKEG